MMKLYRVILPSVDILKLWFTIIIQIIPVATTEFDFGNRFGADQECWKMVSEGQWVAGGGGKGKLPKWDTHKYYLGRACPLRLTN